MSFDPKDSEIDKPRIPPSSPRFQAEGGNNQGLMLFLGLGMALTIEIAVAAGLGWWAGMWVDKRFGIAPIGMILGIVLFMGIALNHAIIALKQAQARFENDGAPRKKTSVREGGPGSDGRP